MADIASGPAGEVTKTAIVGVRAGVGYLVYFRETIENLETKVKMLSSHKNDVLQRMDAATRNGESTLAAVETWLNRVEIAEVESNILLEKATKIDRKYKGWLHSRFSLSRKAQDRIARIKELLDEMNDFRESVSHPKRVQDLGSSAVLFPIGDYHVFPSREPVRIQILEAIKDEYISLVGVYGVEGVGKTMFMKALANHVKRYRIFQDVAIVNLGQEPQIKEIQGDVANQIDLKFQENDTLLSRSQLLSHRLMAPHWKTLIILDDVREGVDLAAVGIPYRDGCKNCKIVFTTSNEDVFKQMDTQKRMNIGAISEEESWALFRKKAGYEMDSPCEAVVREISECCRGIPADIVAIARSLHGDSELVI